jgi:histone-lysine N-methyltransferase SETD2
MYMNNSIVIDATRKGGVSRFINHSCDPNCKVQEWRVKGEPRMGIFSIKPLQVWFT